MQSTVAVSPGGVRSMLIFAPWKQLLCSWRPSVGHLPDVAVQVEVSDALFESFQGLRRYDPVGSQTTRIVFLFNESGRDR